MNRFTSDHRVYNRHATDNVSINIVSKHLFFYLSTSCNTTDLTTFCGKKNAQRGTYPSQFLCTCTKTKSKSLFSHIHTPTRAMYALQCCSSSGIRVQSRTSQVPLNTGDADAQRFIVFQKHILGYVHIAIHLNPIATSTPMAHVVVFAAPSLQELCAESGELMVLYEVER